MNRPRLKFVGRRGFILIIVLALLGILAWIALSFVTQSQVERNLSLRHMYKVRSRLLARSGAEKGILNYRSSQFTAHEPLGEGTLTEKGDRYHVFAKDCGGLINVNDGMRAGQRELGHQYVPASLKSAFSKVRNGYVAMIILANSSEAMGWGYGPDWWSVDPTDPIVFTLQVGNEIRFVDDPQLRIVTAIDTDGISWLLIQTDIPDQIDPVNGHAATASVTVVTESFDVSAEAISGHINLRVRRLLNAYGNAHRYLDSFQGMPDVGMTNYGMGVNPFVTTSDAPQIGKEIPFYGGLGDMVISRRPAAGYTSFGSMRSLLDSWGASNLSTAYLKGAPFSVFCTGDLTVVSHEDDDGMRLTQPFASTWPLITRSSFDGKSRMPCVSLDTSPPNISTDAWAPHSVSPIFLNAASTLVKAAVFYALADTMFLCEGSRPFSAVPSGMLTNWWGYMKDYASSTPMLGMSGCVFRDSKITENGFPCMMEDNRFMSMRDSLILAQRYETYISTVKMPMSFDEFRELLVWKRLQGPDYERAESGVYDDRPDRGYFSQEYAERALPHLLCPLTRVPGFMGAPAAMCSPVFATTTQQIHGNPANSSLGHAPLVRKAEDVIPRAHLPKVSFRPSGLMSIYSHGFVLDSNHVVLGTSTVSVVIRFSSMINYRSQKSFEELTVEDETSPEILIGPVDTQRRTSTISPDSRFGMVGLRDIPDYPNWDYPAKVSADFTTSDVVFASFCRGNCPQAPTVTQDVFLGFVPGGLDQYIGQRSTASLVDSLPEGGNHPYLGATSDGCDLSPQGGLMFTSWRHGPGSAKLFGDSLYWRLNGPSVGPNVMIDPLNPVGASTNKGMMQMWFRIPTGQEYPTDIRIPGGYAKARRVLHVLGHIRLWEKVPEGVPPRYQFIRGGFYPVDLILAYSYNTVTSRHEVIGLYMSRASSLDPVPLPWSIYRGDVFGCPILPVTTDDTLPVQTDTLKVCHPSAHLFYQCYLDDGHFTYRKIAVLRDIPENAPGTWHRATFGWNLTREGIGNNTGGADWHPSYLPYDEKLWVRLHDASNVESYSANLLYGNRMYPGPVSDQFGVMDTNVRGYSELNNPYMVMSLGEVQAHPVIPGLSLPAWRLESALDNVRITLGGLPTGYVGGNASAFQSPSFSDQKPIRYNIKPTHEPSWFMKTGVSVGQLITRIGAQVFIPHDSKDGLPQGPNVPALDLDLVDVAGGSAVVIPPISTCAQGHEKCYAGLSQTPTLRIRATYRAVNSHGNPLLNDGTDNWTEIPWIGEVSVSYENPNQRVKVILFEMGED